MTAAIAPELPGPTLASDNSVDPMLLTDLVPGKATLRTDVADYEREDAPPGSKEDQERKAKRAAEARKICRQARRQERRQERREGGKAATAAKDQPRRAKRPAGTAAHRDASGRPRWRSATPAIRPHSRAGTDGASPGRIAADHPTG